MATSRPETPLRVLITNITLAGRSGTETYVRDLAMQLRRAGQCPLIYSPDPGPIADELRHAGLEVVDDLALISEAPDVIHGHHVLETLSALSHFPDTPGLFVCHDRKAWHDMPPRHPRVLAHVAVDENCRDRLVGDHGLDRDSIRVLLNAVDLERFTERPPLPQTPRSAVLYGNAVSDRAAQQVLREACEERGIAFETMSGVERPETRLRDFEIVFAKARCALEALAVGSAVVLYHDGRMGPLVTSENFRALRPLNFGIRAITTPATTHELGEQLGLYDTRDAARVCALTRADAGLEHLAAAWLGLYREIIALHTNVPRCSPIEEMRIVADDLRRLEILRRTRWLEAEILARDREIALRDREIAHRDHEIELLRDDLRTVHDWRPLRVRHALMRQPLIQRLRGLRGA